MNRNRARRRQLISDPLASNELLARRPSRASLMTARIAPRNEIRLGRPLWSISPGGFGRIVNDQETTANGTEQTCSGREPDFCF